MELDIDPPLRRIAVTFSASAHPFRVGNDSFPLEDYTSQLPFKNSEVILAPLREPRPIFPCGHFDLLHTGVTKIPLDVINMALPKVRPDLSLIAVLSPPAS